MSWCLFFNVLFGLWAAVVTVLYFVADAKYWDQKGWVTRTQNEIDYIRERHPALWQKVADKLSMRYLDESHE